MNERVAAARGTLHVTSKPGAGMTIEASLQTQDNALDRWAAARTGPPTGLLARARLFTSRNVVPYAAAVVIVAAVALVHSPAAAARGSGRTLIELRPMAHCDAAAMLQGAGATTVSAALRLYRLDDRTAARVLPSIRACRALRFTEPDRVAGTLTVTDFSDPLVPTEWWRTAIGVADLAPPGPGKAVTIVDSGVDVFHPDFVGRPNLVMLNTQEPQPIGGVHGTAVASLIGAPVNGVGIVGIYPEALLQSWDAARGEGTQLAASDVVAGILAAASQGPGVINLSLGGPQLDVSIQQAIATAVRKGMLIVAAAGNDGETGSPLTYPASLPHVLTVAATDEQNQVTSFSSRSRFVDLAAPGKDMTVANALDNSWAQKDGTSFAAPLVSGAAAWVWTVRPDLDASQLFEVMRRSATDIGPAGPDDASGYGLLNFPAAIAYRAPVPDPFEPNDDINYVKPGALYDTGVPPLTTRATRSTTLTARLDTVKDPRDVYRVYIPARGRITVTTRAAAAVTLTLWGPKTTSVLEQSPNRDRLARGVINSTAETVTYTNTGTAKMGYLAVTLTKGTHDATYRIAVSAR